MTLVTPAARVSEWTVNTMEHDRIHRRLVELGVELVTSHALAAVEGSVARIVETIRAANGSFRWTGSSS